MIYTAMFDKQFRQQNLATSKFLVKCLLFTASFLNSRKKMSMGRTQKKRFMDKNIYQKLSYVSDVPS